MPLPQIFIVFESLHCPLNSSPRPTTDETAKTHPYHQHFYKQGWRPLHRLRIALYIKINCDRVVRKADTLNRCLISGPFFKSPARPIHRKNRGNSKTCSIIWAREIINNFIFQLSERRQHLDKKSLSGPLAKRKNRKNAAISNSIAIYLAVRTE